MRPTDAYDHFETTFSYPIAHEDIVAATGDTTVQAPTGPSESIAEVLDRAAPQTFHSPRDLHETFLANLGEQYIGRKFYDDRGGPVEPADATTMTI
ncbi:MAG: hypothetical protein ABEJ81_05165 [Haloferacaceae archaeon]